MNTRRLQRQLDSVLATTGQRVFLGAFAVLAVLVPSVAMARVTPLADAWMVVLVGLLALVVAVEPDEHLGAIVMAISVMHWFWTDPDVTSPWSVGLAASLLAFHSVVALMAVTPHTSVVGWPVLARWSARSLGAVLTAVGVWALVVVFQRREAEGSVALSVAAFVLLGVAIVTFGLRTTDEGSA